MGTGEAKAGNKQDVPGSFWEVFQVFIRLGLTSFGGPIAHLGYLHNEVVHRRKWVDEQTYADLVALCQFLPGPASSQVGIGLGIARAGLVGGVAAWLGFTLPSAIVLILFAFGFHLVGNGANAGWLHGLKIAAVAVVTQALWGMATTLCPDRTRATVAIVAAIATLAWPTGVGQVLIIAVAGLIGWQFFSAENPTRTTLLQVSISRRLALASWGTFLALLLTLPLLRQFSTSHSLALFESFFRVGSLVFGGGHVVLPLIHAEVVPPGWVTNEQFVAGYGAAQAIPGPLFTFSAYLGAVSNVQPNGWTGGALALIAVFLPSFLLVIGMLPFWNRLRLRADFQGALRGINAAVVGLLLAALYHPVWTSAIHTPQDFMLGLAAFGLLALWKWPSWSVVGFCALGGGLLAIL